jgi:hypothetical protein
MTPSPVGLRSTSNGEPFPHKFSFVGTQLTVLGPECPQRGLPPLISEAGNENEKVVEDEDHYQDCQNDGDDSDNYGPNPLENTSYKRPEVCPTATQGLLPLNDDLLPGLDYEEHRRPPDRMRVLPSPVADWSGRFTSQGGRMKAAKKVKTVTKTAVLEVVGAVGIDLGDRWSHWCVLSTAGEVMDRGRVKTSAEALSDLSAGWAKIPVAIENGTDSGWVSRPLRRRAARSG